MQNPLHADKDERKSEKSERDSAKSKKDEKIMEGLAHHMNPGAKNANAKKEKTKRSPTGRRCPRSCEECKDISHCEVTTAAWRKKNSQKYFNVAKQCCFHSFPITVTPCRLLF